MARGELRFEGDLDEERLTRSLKEFQRNSLSVLPAVIDVPPRVVWYGGRDTFVRAIETGSFYAVDQRCTEGGSFAHGVRVMRNTIAALDARASFDEFHLVLADTLLETERFAEHPYGFFIGTFFAIADAAAVWDRMPDDACSIVLRREQLGDQSSFKHWFVRVLHDPEAQQQQLQIVPMQACIAVADAAGDDGGIDENFRAALRSSAGGRMLLALTLIGDPARRELQECRMVVRCDDPALRFVIRPEPHRCPSLPISLRNHDALGGRLPIDAVIMGPRVTQAFAADVRHVLLSEYGDIAVRQSEHSHGR